MVTIRSAKKPVSDLSTLATTFIIYLGTCYRNN